MEITTNENSNYKIEIYKKWKKLCVKTNINFKEEKDIWKQTNKKYEEINLKKIVVVFINCQLKKRFLFDFFFRFERVI